MENSNLRSALLLTAGLLLTLQPALAASGTGNPAPRSTTAATPGRTATAAPTPEQTAVLGWLQEQGDYTSLLRVIEAADYGDRMASKASVTILAPTDAAFEKLPAGVVETLLQPENRNLLTEVINFHLLPGRQTTAALAKRKSVMTLGGDLAPITNVDGKLRIASGQVLEGDNEVGTATVDSIDAVLFPPDVVDRLEDLGYTLTAAAPAAAAGGIVLASSLQHRDGQVSPPAEETAAGTGYTWSAATGGYVWTDSTTGRNAPGGPAGYAISMPYSAGGTDDKSNSAGDWGNFYDPSLAADATVFTPNMIQVLPGERWPRGAVRNAPEDDNHSSSSAGRYTAQAEDSADELDAALRTLWLDHAQWKRGYIIAAVAGQPQTGQAALDKLSQNTSDLQLAFTEYFGSAAGSRLGALLTTHNAIDRQVVDAAVRHDTLGLEDHKAQLEANAREIARFLSQLNPDWPEAATAELLQQHLETTGAELQARLADDAAADTAASASAQEQVLRLADYLADGIAAQQLAELADTANSGIVMGSSRHRQGYGHDRARRGSDSYSSGPCCCR